MPKCKSCKANIVWAETDKGVIPLDSKSERRFIRRPGSERKVDLVPTWQSHYATCPDADQPRKAKAAAPAKVANAG